MTEPPDVRPEKLTVTEIGELVPTVILNTSDAEVPVNVAEVKLISSYQSVLPLTQVPAPPIPST